MTDKTAERVERANGRVVLGEAKQPLRNGSMQYVLCWEAALIPAKECEGGGWYSSHPTERHWAIRYWLEHKGQPGLQWPPKVADSYSGSLDAQRPLADRIADIVEREKKRRGLGAALRTKGQTDG